MAPLLQLLWLLTLLSTVALSPVPAKPWADDEQAWNLSSQELLPPPASRWTCTITAVLRGQGPC